jgi:gluconate 2-dehydrogenase gamma chain
MTSKSEWAVVGAPVDQDSEERLFFDEHQWATVEAATARIIPTDQDPGAREARAVRFIDRYLSGTDYVFAAADGSGFLRLEGLPAAAWRERIDAMQDVYRRGIAELDAIAARIFGSPFRELDDEQQDAVLVDLSGAPKPEPVRLGKGRPASTFLQGVSDDGMGFFDALVLHTRQGYYGDPAYGGNKDRVGWKAIGFPGPESLADTNTCAYGVREHFCLDYDWADLIPNLRSET